MPVRKVSRSIRRAVGAAFRILANGVDERTAGGRTRGFYRSSGMPWTRSLG